MIKDRDAAIAQLWFAEASYVFAACADDIGDEAESDLFAGLV